MLPKACPSELFALSQTAHVQEMLHFLEIFIRIALRAVERIYFKSGQVNTKVGNSLSWVRSLPSSWMRVCLLTGVHFWPFSKIMKCVLSPKVWKNSSVSTTVPSSSSTRVTSPLVMSRASRVCEDNTSETRNERGFRFDHSQPWLT